MKSAIFAFITILVIYTPIQLPAAGVGAIYSNAVQDTKETYDCSGFTVRVTKNQPNQMEIYFTEHEGGCGIEGTKAEDVNYSAEKETLSFSVPFESSAGIAYYKFAGKITENQLIGKLKIEYPAEPKYNHIEKIELKKTTKKKLFQCR
jgi:hypothetical protein